MLIWGRLFSLFFVVLIILSGCNVSPKPVITVSGLAFYNDTNNAIENIKLTVVESSKMVSCNLVEPQSYCGTGFPQTQYQGADLILSWQTQHGLTLSRPVRFTQPAQFDSLKRYAAVIKFTDANNFETFFTINPRPF